ncbi:MAG: serine/threonine protein kinase [Anaerolineae bacterium]|jgi:serine/threonine protein kinase|nr:serine/threonine protein kinase [Anaerolineae bacterium]
MPNLTHKTLLNRYNVQEFLGRGGMAEVYKVWDSQRITYLAMKVLLEDFALDRVFTRRFTREANTLAQLQHPNIVPILEYGDYESQPYLVMKYIPGGTLKDLLRSGAMDYKKAAQLLVPIARGLDYAHRQNMFHRDVKPSNILITEDGEPMLTDERSDIYGLGIVFYEMITGRKPYQADTPAALIFKQVTDPLPRPSTFKPDLPDVVEGVLLKALAKDSNNRYQSMKEFAVALAELTTGSPPKKKAEPVSSSKKEKSILQKKTRKQLTPPPKKIEVSPKLVAIIFGGFALIMAAIFGLPPLMDSLRSSSVPTVSMTKTRVPTNTPTQIFSLTMIQVGQILVIPVNLVTPEPPCLLPTTLADVVVTALQLL